MINIHNIRLGFATNSSSSHSIVVVDDEIRKKLYDDHAPTDQDYGWDKFILISKEEKSKYLGQQVKNSFIKNGLDDDSAAALASHWVKEKIKVNGGVDHQSSFDFPSDIYRQSYSQNLWTSREFFNKVYEEILKDNYVIVGGNDNGENEIKFKHKVPKWLQDLFYSSRNNNSDSIVKYDEVFDYYTLFNTKDGTKIRISFDNKKINRASTPDLIDLKITDKCNSNCKYCYQNSSKNGKHADIAVIENIFNMVEALDIFEVALGGGEPTLHQYFERILQDATRRNIVCNFSTRNIKYLIDNIYLLNTMKIGGIGISVNNSKDLENIFKHSSELGKLKSSIVFQHVLGVTDEDDLNKMFDILLKFQRDYDIAKVWGGNERNWWYTVPILLLGYKTVGRGNSFDPIKLNLIDILSKFKSKNKWYTIGLDTLLVSQNKKGLKKFSDPVFWTSEEGVFSYYFDAVDNKMGSSSYETPDKMFKLNCDFKWFKEFYSLTPDERIVREIIK